MRNCLVVIGLLLMFCGSAAAETTIGFVSAAGGLGDLSYNDMTYGGLRRAQQELGFRLVVLELRDKATADDEELKSVIAQSEGIFFLGIQHAPQIRFFARLFPEKKFIIFDKEIAGHSNVASLMFAGKHGSFLAGMLAGLTTKSGKVAVVGGTPMAEVQELIGGFTQGVAAAKRDVLCSVRYVAKENDYSGFANPQEANTIAKELYADGVDIIFALAGLSGNGIVEAARQTKDRYVIGADGDQDGMAKGKVLTSVMKRLDIAAYDTAKKIVQGRFEPGATLFSLESGGVSLTDMRYSRHIVSDQVRKKLERAKQQLIHGELVVTSDVKSVE